MFFGQKARIQLNQMDKYSLAGRYLIRHKGLCSVWFRPAFALSCNQNAGYSLVGPLWPLNRFKVQQTTNRNANRNSPFQRSLLIRQRFSSDNRWKNVEQPQFTDFFVLLVKFVAVLSHHWIRWGVIQMCTTDHCPLGLFPSTLNTVICAAKRFLMRRNKRKTLPVSKNIFLQNTNNLFNSGSFPYIYSHVLYFKGIEEFESIFI